MTFAEPDDLNASAPEGLRKEMKRLKAENKELREAAAERDRLQRERNFLHAGVPLDDRRASYFIAGYQGDQTPEAIKAEWQATFGTSQGSGDGQDHQVEEELAQLGRIAETTSGPHNNLAADRLAERDKKLASLNQNDPRLGEKFDSIMQEYGGRTGSMVG